MKIISNSSPLIFLAKIGKLDFLKGYQLLVPEQVIGEVIGRNKEKEQGMLIENWLRKNSATVKRPELLRNLPDGLGDGEKAAISLAVAEGVRTILLDERKARKIAKLLDLHPKGTIGVIYEQLLRGNIKRHECKYLVLELVKTGYRIKEELLAEFLQNIDK